MCKVLRDYNQEKFKELFFICESSPSGLRYSVPNNCKGVNFRDAGDVVGSLRINKRTGTSAWYVKMGNNSAYAIHRIVWFLAYGEISPDKVIDHIDGDPTNNRLNNLRLVDQGQNNRNAKKNKLNTSGISGVYYELACNRWCAIWRENGKQHKKSFSIGVYGDNAKTLAIEYRNNILERFGYTERHGI